MDNSTPECGVFFACLQLWRMTSHQIHFSFHRVESPGGLCMTIAVAKNPTLTHCDASRFGFAMTPHES